MRTAGESIDEIIDEQLMKLKLTLNKLNYEKYIFNDILIWSFLKRYFVLEVTG
jgi:hypothetical protein